MNFKDIIRDEFKLSNLKYQYHDHTVFHRSQWMWSQCVYVTVRIVMAMYVTYGYAHELLHYYTLTRLPKPMTNITGLQAVQAMVQGGNHDIMTFSDADSNRTEFGEHFVQKNVSIHHFHQWDRSRPWFVFFTMWTYTVLFCHLWLSAVLACIFYRQNTKEKVHDPNYKDSPPQATNHQPKGYDNPGWTSIQGGVDFSCHVQNDAAVNVRTSKVKDTENEEKEVIEQNEDASSVKVIFDFPRTERLAWYFRISWFLADIAAACAPLVTATFFLALYKGGPLDIFNINVHVMNTAMVVLDHLICARPVKFLHFWPPAIFGTVYVIFSVAFWSTNHRTHVVYPGVLDWNHPLASMISLAVMTLAILLCQFVWLLTYQFKLWVHSKLNLSSVNSNLNHK